MPLDGWDDVLVEDVQVEGGQQLGLGREVQVDRLARHTGPLRDRLEAGTVVAVLLEQHPRGIEDLVKAGAKQLAVAISGYGGAAQAAATLEGLA
jgi:hypothetical protein